MNYDDYIKNIRNMYRPKSPQEWRQQYLGEWDIPDVSDEDIKIRIIKNRNISNEEFEYPYSFADFIFSDDEPQIVTEEHFDSELFDMGED